NPFALPIRLSLEDRRQSGSQPQPAPVSAFLSEERTMQDINEKAAKIWVLALTSVASFMVALDALVVTTALSTIRLDLAASIEALEWTVNACGFNRSVQHRL